MKTELSEVSPGLFTADSQGTGPPAAIAIRYQPDGQQVLLPVFECHAVTCTALPLDLSGGPVYLLLFGTGIRGLSSPANVTCSAGGVAVPVQYAGPQNAYVGMDQVNLLIPADLAAAGQVDLLVTVDGYATNTVRMAFK